MAPRPMIQRQQNIRQPPRRPGRGLQNMGVDDSLGAWKMLSVLKAGLNLGGPYKAERLSGRPKLKGPRCPGPPATTS